MRLGVIGNFQHLLKFHANIVGHEISIQGVVSIGTMLPARKLTLERPATAKRKEILNTFVFSHKRKVTKPALSGDIDGA
jgi:hypothetical protein